MTLDPISIATRGYVCGDGPDAIAIALRGYICIGVAVVIEQRGGDSSKPGLRLEPVHPHETPAMIRQRILQEDEELLMIVAAAFGVINND